MRIVVAPSFIRKDIVASMMRQAAIRSASARP